MVRVHYNDFDEQYQFIQESACGRQACTVLILVAFDIDAMAATKMITQLLRADHITYSICAVLNFDEVKAALKKHLTNDIKSVIMMNCGAVRSNLSSFGCYSFFLYLNVTRSMIFQSILI
jgi:hypothetical protein